MAYHSAQPSQKAGQLNVRSDPFKYPHVCEPDFLRRVQPLVNHRADGKRGDESRTGTNFDELKFRILRYARSTLVVSEIIRPRSHKPSVFRTHSSNTFVTLNTVTMISTALYPASHNSLSFSRASSMFPLTQCRSIVCTIKGCG